MGKAASELFKYVREKDGLSQNKFAKKLNVNQSTISRIEANVKEPGSFLMKKLYNYSGKNLNQLLNEIKFKYVNINSRKPIDHFTLKP